jgi:Xaa-Pro dipeptidase
VKAKEEMSELEEKTGRVVRFLGEEKLGGVLLGGQHNFAWLTGGGRSGIDLSREPGAGSLLVRADGRRFVVSNNIESARLLNEELGGEGGWEPVVFDWTEEKANAALPVERARALLESGAELGVDLPTAGGARVVEGAFARVRFELTEEEIERFRGLGRDAGRAVGEVARGLEPGLTEREVARRANDALAAVGAHSVVTLVAADERLGLYRHPVPTEKRWEKVLMVVVCARRGGLIASLTRIVCAGDVPDELRRRTEATARVNAAGPHVRRVVRSRGARLRGGGFRGRGASAPSGRRGGLPHARLGRAPGRTRKGARAAGVRVEPFDHGDEDRGDVRRLRRRRGGRHGLARVADDKS